MLRTPLPTSSQQQQTLLEQQQLQACTSAKGAEPQSRSQNALFAHNSAPSSSSTKITNGKMSSIASLKQIVHPQQQLSSTVTHKGSIISNNTSQNSLDHKAILGMNFSQSNISTNQNAQNQQLNHPGSHHQRSFSNQKITKSKGSKNNGMDQVLKSNLSSSELQLNGISFGLNNLQNFAVSSQGNSQHQQLEIGHNSVNSLSPPKFMANQQFQSGEAPYNMFKQNQQNYKKQKPAGSNSAIYASSAIGIQQQQSSAMMNSSTKASLNMKRPKCLNAVGSNNQSYTPKHQSSLSPDNIQLLGSINGDKQSQISQIDGINDNFNKKQAILPAQSPNQSIAFAPPVGNIKPVNNVVQNKPTNSSCSEHKINVGSGRNGITNASTLNNHILLSINQSQSIRRKMNSNSQSIANINSIINGNSSCIVYSKNTPTNYQTIQQESASLNATSFSPSPSSICFGSQLNSLKLNSGQSSSQVVNGVSAGNSKNLSNYKQDQQDNGGNNNQNNSSTNIIFEKVKKRKMDNPTAGGGHQQSSQQQLQYLIQSKSSQMRSPVANPSQILSKTMSFSGHQNHFYSPNSYIKQPSAPSTASTLLQNQTVGAITSKLKAKNIFSHQDGHSFGFSSSSQGTHALSTGTGAAHTNSNSKALISPPQTSDGVSSGNNTNHGRNGHSQNPKMNKENVVVHLPDQNYLSLNFSVGDQQFQNGASSPSGQTSQDPSNPYNHKKLGQFSESLVDRHNPGEVIIVKRENLSPNGNLRLGNSPSQKGTCKLILNKLSQFDLSSSLNPMEHISEIVSLIHLSVVDTPLETVLGKFEENIQKINLEMRYREKQQANKLAGKQKELEELRREAETLAIKLDQVNFNKKNMFGNTKAVDGQTQTSQKKRREQKNSKNAIIQICDQNGNVQEVDTDKENDMLRDYILDQEKKVNVFKEKEGKMIKLLLAVKKRGIDIDQIYNADVINDESADEIVKTAPQHVKLPFSGRQAKLDPEVFRKIDNDQQYADESIFNESDESSFGFIGKIRDQDESAVIAQKPVKSIKGQKKLVPKQLQQKLKLNLDHLNEKNNNSDDDEEDTEDKENRLFHEHILATLQITQDQLDALQDQIQKNPNNLSPEQINLIQQIHVLQQQHEQDLQAKQQKNQKGKQFQNEQQISGYQGEKDGVILNIDGNSSDNPMMFSENFLPSELKDQLTAITHHSNDEDYEQENKDCNEFQGYQTTAFVPSSENEFKQYFMSQ